MISEPFFRIVFGQECGLPCPLLVGYGRGRGAFTADEVHAMICHKLRRIYRDAERYGVCADARVHVANPVSLFKDQNGYYRFNAETVALQVPSY